jgi:hypothetical protein
MGASRHVRACAAQSKPGGKRRCLAPEGNRQASGRTPVPHRRMTSQDQVTEIPGKRDE